MQELDCDVCKILGRILQRLDRIEQRLSRLEHSHPRNGYDPVWTELDTRIGNTYRWPRPYSKGDDDRFVVGQIVWGGPDGIDEWVAMDSLHADRWATLGVLRELEDYSRRD